MENRDACPQGGEHDIQHLTGLCGGLYCIKCWRPQPDETLKNTNPCPNGGQHVTAKGMGNWGQPRSRRCIKCDQEF